MLSEKKFIYTKELLDKITKKAIYNLYGIEINKPVIDVPRDASYGDFSSNIAFELAKRLRRKPEDIVEELVNTLNEKPPLLFYEPIFIVSSYNNFVNFRLSIRFKLWLINKIYSSFGLDKVLIQNKDFLHKKIVVEYASPNPNKAMHLGHFRNIAIALPLINMFKLLGAKVYTDMVLNDKGIAISKAMVGYLAYGRKDSQFELPKSQKIDKILNIEKWFENKDQWLMPEDVGLESGKFVDKFYVLGNQLVKENKQAEKIAYRFVSDWEVGIVPVVSLWELIISWSVQSQQRLFKRLNAYFDTVWRESDHYLLGKQVVRKALNRGLLEKGKGSKKDAIVANLDKEKLGQFVLLRSDGTSLYSTQDVALSKLKIQTYKADEYYWVVGAEQSFYFKQLFATLRKMNIASNQKLIHVGYALLLTGGKKASSRQGQANHLIDFLDNIQKFIVQEYGLDVQSAQILADFIAKVAVVKVGALRDYNFDIKEASQIKGHTGAYLMYTYVRAKQVLSKYYKSVVFGRWLFDFQHYTISVTDEIDSTQTLTDKDIDLVNVLSMFPEYLKKSARLLDPAILVNYAFTVADVFNSYYESTPVLKSEEKIREFRLYLVHAVKVLLETIINTLGSQTVDKM